MCLESRITLHCEYLLDNHARFYYLKEMLYEITKISLFVLVTKRRKDWAASLQFCPVTKVKSKLNSPTMHMLIYCICHSNTYTCSFICVANLMTILIQSLDLHPSFSSTFEFLHTSQSVIKVVC